MDMLDQMELTDISDQEALDVFFGSGGEEGVLTPPLPGMKTSSKTEIIRNVGAKLYPSQCFSSDSQSVGTTTTTTRKSSAMDSSETSSRVLMPSPACPPHLQTPPPTARPPTPTAETPLLSRQTMRRHTPAQSRGEPQLRRERG